MLCLFAVGALVVSWSGAAFGQAVGVLHIRISLKDPASGSTPVARHALLISDNPATSAPRRVVTATDGTLDVRLHPGNYTVESDEPVAFGGKGYQWTRTVDVTAGGEAVLELTADNAEVGAAPAASASGATNDMDAARLLPLWQGSVVAVWTPQSRASGFVVDAAGLVVTSQRLVGTASAVDVQLTPSLKVAARILVANRVRDVAVLWIDPAITSAIQPVPLGCESGAQPFSDRQRFVTIGAPIGGPKELSPGDVFKVEPHAIVADFRLAPGSTGGPVFNTAGGLVGLSSVVDDEDERRRRDARIVPIDDVCQVMPSARKAMLTTPPPAAARLPVEPLQAFPAGALDAAVKRHVGNSTPYKMTSSDFDIAFLTPALVSTQAKDLGAWSDYFAATPSVLVVRVTPKLTESFWTTIARGAAYTQGMALPPIKHFKPGFARLRALCGDVEVQPIHPFVVERRVSETDAIREGLYAFDPQALGPQCKPVRLVLFSEKAAEKPDSRVVDPLVIEQIWQDFAPYRALVTGRD